MKKCPFCGYENEEQTEVCFHCKAALPHAETNKTEEPVKGSRRKNKE